MSACSLTHDLRGRILPTHFVDITGMIFNAWTVVRRVGGATWEFKCECGRLAQRDRRSITSGNSTSCGCRKYKHQRSDIIKAPIPPMGTSWIPLTKGAFALVDCADFPTLSRFYWYLSSSGYATRDQERKRIRMHKEILVADMGMEVDHRNGDKLDNARANLRSATHQQNACNRGPQRNNTSGYKGVTWDKKRNKWSASVHFLGKRHFAGRFNEPNKASEAYFHLATTLNGEFASK